MTEELRESLIKTLTDNGVRFSWDEDKANSIINTVLRPADLGFIDYSQLASEATMGKVISLKEVK